MTTGDSKSQPALGFFTILEHEAHGLVGGYLILNAAGRPLEFHCTAPVKPNRAQQILFGPTLDSYLCGEQIGQTLVTKSSLPLLALCTDVERALCVRDYVSLPVALVLHRESPPSEGANFVHAPATSQANTWRVDAPHRAGPHLAQSDVGRNRLAVPPHRDADRQALVERLESVAGLDLVEPFERIRQAVEEAHKTTRA
jgi:hypothetical protein